MTGTALKLIAILSMLIDHVGAVFFPEIHWMRYVGRIAMPVFSFCVAEGYAHTHDRRRYLINLLAFALLSELPFDLAFSGTPDFGHQNILFTFAFSVAALMVYDRITAPAGRGTSRSLLGLSAVFAFAVLALLLKTNYSLFAVLSVFLFYVFRDRRQPVRALAGVGFLAVTRTMGMYAWTGLGLIPLLFYNGQRGRGWKWLFYLFYPVHLLVLYLIKNL